MGSDLSEDQRFREFFRCSAEVALIMWNLLIKHLLLPDEAQIVHLLWALIFMKIYAKEKVTCGAAGGQMGGNRPQDSTQLHLADDQNTGRFGAVQGM